VSAASRWAFLDRFGWRPEGCTEVVWSRSQRGIDSVEHRSMKRVLDPFNAQIRANLLKTGLVETLRRRVQARAVQLSTGNQLPVLQLLLGFLVVQRWWTMVGIPHCWNVCA
jgi:hypothetical protein